MRPLGNDGALAGGVLAMSYGQDFLVGILRGALLDLSHALELFLEWFGACQGWDSDCSWAEDGEDEDGPGGEGCSRGAP